MAILTVSREYGSGGREIGRAVASGLGYDYVDKESIIAEVRRLGHKWEQWTQEMDEHSPSVWEKYDWSFRGFTALMENIIWQCALRNNVVIIGRGANHILKNVPHALRIRIVAPLESRITRVMDRESVNRDTARWMIQKIDQDRAGFVFTVFGKPWDDQADYDYTLNTGFKSLDEITQAVMELLRERDKLADGSVQLSLTLRAEAARIRAGLLTNPRLFIPTLDVQFDGRRIVLRGIVHNPKEHKRVEEEARRLSGETAIRCELHYRS